MCVDRCVCHDVRFSTLLAMHRATGAGFEELSAKTGCGTGCGMCRDYIKLAIRTGKDRLPVMHPDTLKRELARESG